MRAFEILLEETTPELTQYLEDRLYESNVAATGISDGIGLGFIIRDETGTIVAGAAGHTWGGTCELRQLWVHADLRHAGMGRRLMQAAEAEAGRRGCRQIVVTTHSFQAPDFYRQLGFEEVSRVSEYPRGHAHLVLRKAIEPRTPAGNH